MRAVRKIIDAEFEVVRGPMRTGQRHPTRRGWYFTGKYDSHGDPLFVVWWLLAMEAVGGSLAWLFAAAALGLVGLLGLSLLIGGVLALFQAVSP